MPTPSRAITGVAGASVAVRDAVPDDLTQIVALLQQLSLGEPREQGAGPLLESYLSAFREIERNPRQRILVAEVDGRVVGTLAFMIVPNLSHHGRPWAHIDNVAVDQGRRGRGYGEALMRYAVDEARRAGCYKVSLTSNKQRVHAHSFYRRLGFSASHEGFRIDFDEAATPSENRASRSR